MSDKAKVDWYGDEMMVEVGAISDELLSELCFFAEGEAKHGAPVDQGFLINAIYSITPSSNGRGAAMAAARAMADRAFNSAPNVEARDAVLHSAANYTIYQELKHGFIAAAVDDARDTLDGLATRVGGEHF